MKYLLFFVAATTLSTITSLSAFASSGGAFSLPGSAVAEFRRQIAVTSGSADAADRLEFIYTRPSHELVTTDAGNRISSKIVAPDNQAPINANTQSVRISGRVALAIVRGIDERTRPILPSMLQREREGRFTIVGYDHGTSIFFSEEFVSPSYAAQSANPLSLDICTPHVSYLIAVPSYTIEKLDVNYCGLTN